VITILFVAANPTDTTRLALDVEYQQIDARLRAAQHREQFRLEIALAMTAGNLTDAMLRYKPTIVHFSGHGSSTGEIILRNDENRATPASAEGVTELFRISKDWVRCVVLNACFSEIQARGIATHIDCVIGMTDRIGDTAAIAFAETFYNALGAGEAVEKAFLFARNATTLNRSEYTDQPQLLVKSGSKASDLRFVTSARSDATFDVGRDPDDLDRVYGKRDR
jgi:hypothetical protein